MKIAPFIIVACAALYCTAAAPFARAQNSDAPAIVNGKPVALTVTGDGSVDVAPVGFVLDVSFYNDAAGEAEARLQNAQTEEKLKKAAAQTGLAPDSIRIFAERVTGPPFTASDGSPIVQQVLINGKSAMKPTDTARSMRNMVIVVKKMNALKPLVAALQSVGASGRINLSYDFGDEKSLRDQTLQAAVADAAKQARIMETAAAPRTLRLITMEAGDFTAPNYSRKLPLNTANDETWELPASYTTAAYQSVVLRYTLVDAPLPAAPKKPTTATAPKKR